MNTIMRWLVVEKPYTGYTEQDEEVKRTYTESPILQYKPGGYGPWIAVPTVKIPFEELTHSDGIPVISGGCGMSGEKIVTPITPTDLRDYLITQGWTVVEAAIKDRLYVFENNSFPRRQLAYPMDMTAPDYRESLDRVFWKLGEITGQKLESLVTKVHALQG